MTILLLENRLMNKIRSTENLSADLFVSLIKNIKGFYTLSQLRALDCLLVCCRSCIAPGIYRLTVNFAGSSVFPGRKKKVVPYGMRIAQVYSTHSVLRAIEMGKRSHEEAEAMNGSAKRPKSDLATKTSRKSNDLVEIPPVANFEVNGGEDEAEAKEARREKKRLKKAKNLEQQVQDKSAGTKQNEDDQAAAEKAARKAEKAKRKAEKFAKKQQTENPSNDAETATAPTPTPTIQSVASYTENAELAALPQSEVDKYLAENFISIIDPTSSTPLRPILKFSYLPATSSSQQDPFKSFKAPTPIQAAAWPFLLAGRDVIGVAETGSGKTMAFAVPCVRYILSLTNQQKFKGAKVVVVSPTRELAMQSHEQITKLAGAVGLQVVCVYGGVPKHEQRKALETADIVVATPGRLNDLIGEGSADLSRVGYVVLDEADRMLDKGFEEEIRKIINTTQPLGKRQTLMFTATWPESVRSLASTFMTSPIKIAIGDNPDGDLRANLRIVQKVEVVDPRGKEFRLLQLLKQYQSGAQKDDRIIVFCLYKKEATRVEGFIRSKGIRVVGIHGDLSQEQRTKSLEAFKSGNTPVLVATDVAARGLDIPAVKLVINCTFPLTVEDYVHRIGRTGRAGKEGLAITLFTEHDKAHSGE